VTTLEPGASSSGVRESIGIWANSDGDHCIRSSRDVPIEAVEKEHPEAVFSRADRNSTELTAFRLGKIYRFKLNQHED